jgi:hypothetical protein
VITLSIQERLQRLERAGWQRDEHVRGSVVRLFRESAVGQVAAVGHDLEAALARAEDLDGLGRRRASVSQVEKSPVPRSPDGPPLGVVTGLDADPGHNR